MIVDNLIVVFLLVISSSFIPRIMLDSYRDNTKRSFLISKSLTQSEKCLDPLTKVMSGCLNFTPEGYKSLGDKISETACAVFRNIIKGVRDKKTSLFLPKEYMESMEFCIPIPYAYLEQWYIPSDFALSGSLGCEAMTKSLINLISCSLINSHSMMERLDCYIKPLFDNGKDYSAIISKQLKVAILTRYLLEALMLVLNEDEIDDSFPAAMICDYEYLNYLTAGFLERGECGTLRQPLKTFSSSLPFTSKMFTSVELSNSLCYVFGSARRFVWHATSSYPKPYVYERFACKLVENFWVRIREWRNTFVEADFNGERKFKIPPELLAQLPEGFPVQGQVILSKYDTEKRYIDESKGVIEKVQTIMSDVIKQSSLEGASGSQQTGKAPKRKRGDSGAGMSSVQTADGTATQTAASTGAKIPKLSQSSTTSVPESGPTSEIQQPHLTPEEEEARKLEDARRLEAAGILASLIGIERVNAPQPLPDDKETPKDDEPVND